jgi:hypothetical protein
MELQLLGKCAFASCRSSFRCSYSRIWLFRTNDFSVGRLMQRPSLIRLLVTTIGLAVGISMIAGKPPADGYHKGLRQTHIVANRQARSSR